MWIFFLWVTAANSTSTFMRISVILRKKHQIWAFRPEPWERIRSDEAAIKRIRSNQKSNLGAFRLQIIQYKYGSHKKWRRSSQKSDKGIAKIIQKIWKGAPYVKFEKSTNYVFLGKMAKIDQFERGTFDVFYQKITKNETIWIKKHRGPLFKFANYASFFIADFSTMGKKRIFHVPHSREI